MWLCMNLSFQKRSLKEPFIRSAWDCCVLGGGGALGGPLNACCGGKRVCVPGVLTEEPGRGGAQLQMVKPFFCCYFIEVILA